MTRRFTAWLEQRRLRREIEAILRDLEAGFARQAIIREGRATAARDAHSAQWKQRGERCRAVFGNAS